MEEDRSISVYDDLFDFIIEKATPEAVLAFKVSPKAQKRAAKLLDKNNAGTLTPKERAELDEMAEFNLLGSALKARALEKMIKS